MAVVSPLRYTIFTAAALFSAAPLYAYGDEAALRQVHDFWLEHGAPPQVATAWAAEVNRESSGDATRIGDGGTSLGAYQHHNGRAEALLLNIENNQAFQELMGADPIAAAHRDEIMNAPNEASARAAIKRYFFRPAGTRISLSSQFAPKPKTEGPQSGKALRKVTEDNSPRWYELTAEENLNTSNSE